MGLVLRFRALWYLDSHQGRFSFVRWFSLWFFKCSWPRVSPSIRAPSDRNFFKWHPLQKVDISQPLICDLWLWHHHLYIAHCEWWHVSPCFPPSDPSKTSKSPATCMSYCHVLLASEATWLYQNQFYSTMCPLSKPITLCHASHWRREKRAHLALFCDENHL